MAELYHAITGIDRMERLAMEDSPVHRIHPMPKLITTLIYIIAVVSFPPHNISGLVPFVFYPAIMMPLSGTPYRPILKMLLAALPFSLMAGLGNLLLMRNTAFHIGSLAVSQGMVSFASVMLKTMLTVFAVLILIATTPFIEINRQLVAMRIPKIFCLSLIMTYRYLSVLLGEAASMFTAYSMRAPGKKGIVMKDMGGFLGLLILRSFDRAERVYQAMKCRGFQNMYHGKKRESPRRHDWVYAVLLSLAILILRFFNLSLFWGGLAG